MAAGASLRDNAARVSTPTNWSDFMTRRLSLGAALVIGILASAWTLAKDPRKSPAAPAASGRYTGPIIDVHLHAYPPDEAIPDIANPADGTKPGVKTGEEHRRAVLAEMKRLDVVRGVVSGGSGDRLAAAIRWREADPARFIAGAGIRGSDDTPLPPLDAVRNAFEKGQLGVIGEVTSEYAGATLGDARYEPFLALAEQLDVPVALHSGVVPPGTSYDPCCPDFRISLGNPLLLEDVLNRHPKLRLSLMHAGWPFTRETIAILFEYPQVYVDVGAGDWLLPREEFHDYLHALLRAGFGRRVMFGSDEMYWPQGIALAIEGVQSAPFLTGEQKRDIFHDNAVRFLELDAGARGAADRR
jgi:predicted TIM-barrel fold metal-dependent hydrolase